MQAEEGSVLNMQHQDPSAEVGEVTVAPSADDLKFLCRTGSSNWCHWVVWALSHGAVRG